ncbi:MAG: hypothetical protein KF833_11650 [Verrucomicrobiae bacterium]|nr:hypothetical protein [Verrucomicrobiae bacterium]
MADVPSPSDEPLSLRLARAIPETFFRPLARPSAPVYVDCADRLARCADEGGQVSHEDCQTLIREALAEHPRAQLGDDEGAEFGDLRQRAGQFYNKLVEAGWLQERRVSLDERWVLITPPLRILLRSLREMATTDPADLRDFAATLRSICQTLEEQGALDPNRIGPEEFRQTVRELLDRVERAIEQMHSVETLILRHAEEQRASESPAETLRRFLVEFQAGEHMVCYDALRQGGLGPRLLRARSVVQDALADPFAKERLAEGLAAHRSLAPTEAYLAAESMLGRLDRGLASIPARQRLIDGRMADFCRLSKQRYDYQTEMRGRRAEQVKSFLAAVNRHHTGQSFSDLTDSPGLPLLSVEVALHFGTDSLYRPRRSRPPVNLDVPPSTDPGNTRDAQELIRTRNLYAITPQRAGRLVERLLPTPGAAVSTESLRLATEDDLLDLLAVLAFDRATTAARHRPIRWRIETVREHLGLTPGAIPIDRVSGRSIERLLIERLS